MVGSLKAYARHRKSQGLIGGSLSAVQRARDSKRITLEPDGQVDFEKANAEWEANTNLRQRRKPEKRAVAEPIEDSLRAQDDGSFLEAQRQREWERVRRERLARLTTEGKLVDAAEIHLQFSRMITAAKTSILLIPDELCEKLAPVTDPVTIREMLHDRLCQALERLVEYRPSA